MKNVISYYYGFDEITLNFENGKYYFNYSGSYYLFEKYLRNADEIYDLYNISIYYGNALASFVFNRYNSLLTEYEGIYYVLLKLNNYDNSFITMRDLINYNYIIDGYDGLLRRNEWKKLWCLKIDYVENLLEEFRFKYKKIRNYVDYYIGFAENAISLLNGFNGNCFLSIAHYRINVDTSHNDFYDPLNIIVDYRVRDIAEYIKYNYIYGSVSLDSLYYGLLNFNYSSDELRLFFIRIMFPSFFFDIFDSDDICLDNMDFDYISSKYNELILYFYTIFRNRGLVPEINWIKK